MENRKLLVVAACTGAAGIGVLAGGVAKWAWREYPDLRTELVGIVIALGATAIVGLIGKWLVQGKPPIELPPWRELLGRLALIALALASAAVVVAWPNGPGVDEDACGDEVPDDAVEVMVVWTDQELDDFCRVVDAYGESPDAVEVTSTGVEIGAALSSRFEERDPPDVAIIPQPSLVKHYGQVGCLEAIDGDVVDRIPPEWNDFVTAERATGPDRVWGAFVKGADKSMFWYWRNDLDDESPIPQDWSWNDLVTWADNNTEDASTAPLALAAATMWPSTDWFENQLAGVDPGVYSALAEGGVDTLNDPEVLGSLRQALQQMVELWTTNDVFVPGVVDIRLEGLDDVLRGESGDTRAMAVFGPSFLAGQEDLYRDERVGVFGFPSIEGRLPRIVGGDIAVVPTQLSGPVVGDDFVDWLTDTSAMARWSRADDGFLAPNVRSPFVDGPDDTTEDWREFLTNNLLNPSSQLFFDLSDDQLATRNQHDPHGSWRLFEELFAAAIDGDASNDQAAINALVDGLEAEYQGELPRVDCDW